MLTENERTRDILDTLRNLQEHKQASNMLLTEEGKREKHPIAITNEPKFGQEVLKNQIAQFRESVDGGAEFTEPSSEDVASSPLIFIPEDKNLVFSGVIPALNNLKFQFVLRTNTGCGCFMWSEGMILNENNLKILHKLQGFYENWKNQWQSEAGDLERMAKGLEGKL